MTWSGYLLSIPFARRQPLLDRHSNVSRISTPGDPCNIPSGVGLRNSSGLVFGRRPPGWPTQASCGDTPLAIATIDRTGAHELPAIAMVGRMAGLAQDGRGGDRLAAHLADRRARVGELGGAGRDDRDPLAQPCGHPLSQAVVDDQGLPDGG